MEGLGKELIKILNREGVSPSLIRNRARAFLEKRAFYSSRGDGNMEMNKESLKTVFSSIRFKGHMGDAIVPIDPLRDRMKNWGSWDSIVRAVHAWYGAACLDWRVQEAQCHESC